MRRRRSASRSYAAICSYSSAKAATDAMLELKAHLLDKEHRISVDYAK